MPNRSRGPIRPTTWIDTRVNLNLLTNSIQNLSLLGAMTEPDARVATLTRTITRLFFVMESPTAVSGVTGLWYGIGVTSRAAFSAAGGIPAIRDPLDKPLDGWVVKDVHIAHDTTVTDARYNVNNVPTQHHDLKAQRKIENGQLFVTFDNEVFSGTGYSLRVAGVIRCLFRL